MPNGAKTRANYGSRLKRLLFKLRELEKYKKKIESNGIVTNPGDMLPGAKRFYVSDPFQNRIEFLEWEPENFIGDQLKKGNIRKPSVLDVSRLAEIHIYGWRHAYKGILSEDLLYNQRQVLRAISMHENIIQNDIDSIDLYDDGIIRGFIIHNDARDSELDGDYEVSAILCRTRISTERLWKPITESC
jgi:hypothetical protein